LYMFQILGLCVAPIILNFFDSRDPFFRGAIREL
jgi:hypothetical protein